MTERMGMELPSAEEMLAEILARPNLDPMIRDLFAMLERNEERRMAFLVEAFASQTEPAKSYSRKAGFSLVPAHRIGGR
jgi:hypothetical protein